MRITGSYDGLLFLMPFTNELVNLARSVFNLPLWVYNPEPSKGLDILTKLVIDTVSLYGVILNLLEASATNFDTLILSTLGLILLIFSFVIPTFLIPYLTTSSIPGKNIIALVIIFVLAIIDRIAMEWAEEFQTLQAESDSERREETKGRAVYYFIVLATALVSVLYLFQSRYKYNLVMTTFVFFLICGLGLLVIEKYLIYKTKHSKHHAPVSTDLI